MNTLEEKEVSQSDYPASPHVKMRIFQQMAEALDMEASALYRRAASFEEEETSLKRAVQEHQTEINRLNFRMQVLRSERSRLVERIDDLEQEADALREEACTMEEDLAPSSVESGRKKSLCAAQEGDTDGWEDEPFEKKILPFRPASEEESRTPVFFNRMTLTDYLSSENPVE
ncbi:MAG: hypothetical protein L0229_11140 [Blastocatellia bacterium]|nr:hypothetical protein [Blastocatellia bacterium]